MTKLPAEAYAIIEGRHSDPFHYLGLHTEGDRKVVRAFLPEASNVEAVGEHGETARLDRIHDAGLFAGAGRGCGSLVSSSTIEAVLGRISAANAMGSDFSGNCWPCRPTILNLYRSPAMARGMNSSQ